MDLFDNYSDQELLITNIQFLGLKQLAWDFTRGMRTVREYHYPNDTIAVRDVYAYTLTADNRGVDAMTRTLEWYDASGALRLTKDVTPDLNIKNKKTINREIRQGRIDYMIAAAEELAQLSLVMPEPFASDFERASNSIDIILKHYELEINHYISNGSEEFEKAVNEEDNPVMMEILSLMVRPPDALFPTGLTIKESIIHQLTGSY